MDPVPMGSTSNDLLRRCHTHLVQPSADRFRLLAVTTRLTTVSSITALNMPDIPVGPLSVTGAALLFDQAAIRSRRAVGRGCDHLQDIPTAVPHPLFTTGPSLKQLSRSSGPSPNRLR